MDRLSVVYFDLIEKAEFPSAKIRCTDFTILWICINMLRLLLPSLSRDTVLAEASAAIGRLDARICASFCVPAWNLRASWMGYARALQLQRYEIEEVDIISRECGLQLAGRPRLETAGDPFSCRLPKLVSPQSPTRDAPCHN